MRGEFFKGWSKRKVVAVIEPVTHASQEKVSDWMYVGIADSPTEVAHVEGSLGVCSALQQMIHGFHVVATTRTSCQSFILDCRLFETTFSERKLVVHYFHSSDLEAGGEATIVGGENVKIDIVPDLVRPVSAFLNVPS